MSIFEIIKIDFLFNILIRRFTLLILQNLIIFSMRSKNRNLFIFKLTLKRHKSTTSNYTTQLVLQFQAEIQGHYSSLWESTNKNIFFLLSIFYFLLNKQVNYFLIVLNILIINRIWISLQIKYIKPRRKKYTSINSDWIFRSFW